MRHIAACLALICAGAGCEDHRPAASGDGPVQLVSGTEVEVLHWVWWLDDRLVYAIKKGPIDVWSRRLDEPGPELIAGGVSGLTVIPGDGQSPGWVATFVVDAEDTETYTLHSLARAEPVVIDRVRRNTVRCYGNGCAMMRGDPGGPTVMWRGRWDALRPIPAGLEIVDLQPDAPGHWLVVASAGGGTARGIYDIADDDSVTELVPPQLGSADMLPGFEVAGPLESASVAGGFQRVCYQGTCRLLYVREMADGTARSFALRRESGRELLLPMAAAPGSIAVAADVRGRAVIWSEVLESSLADPFKRLRYNAWDLLTDRVDSCDLGKVAREFVAGAEDGEILFYGGGQTTHGGFTVQRLGQPCASIEQPSWFFAQDPTDNGTYSTSLHTPLLAPDHATIVWLSDQDAGFELWAADSDGNNVRKLMDAGDSRDFRFLDRADELLLKHALIDGDSWSLLELGAGQPLALPLAEGVFRDWLKRDFVKVGPRSLLLGTGRNAQDGTGELSLVDLDSGSRRVLDTSVQGFAAFPGDVVLYSVRGRYPSARDGFWVRRLP